MARKETKLTLKEKPIIFWIFLISIVFLLFLTVSNVASVLMWGDESLRAMMGSSTRIMGYPSHWNGIRFVVGVPENILSNIFSDPYAEISSWLQYYIIAGSYSLFGTSTFTTRFPFWIAGFAIFGVLYFYRHLLPKSDKVYILTTVLLLLNATFLVYTVQANYYIYALLLTLLSTFIFIKILSSDKISIVNLFFLLIIHFLLSHNHIPTAIAIFISQSLFYVIFKRTASILEQMKLVIFSMMSGGFLYIAYRLYSSNDVIQPGKFFFTSIVVALTQINFYIISGFGMLLILYVLYKYWNKIQGKIWLFYIMLTTIIHIVLLSYFNYAGAMPFRYISSYMVLWLIGLSIVMVSIPRKWAIIIFCFIVIVNFFSGISKLFNAIVFPRPVMDMVYRDIPTIPLISNSSVRCFYCEYLGNTLIRKPHPLENVILALKQMNIENKKIIAGPCEGNTIMFYTKGIVIDQIPKQLYGKIYKKSFTLSDADIIINNSFCPSDLDHENILKQGYSFLVLPLSQQAFINDGEFNVRSAFYFPAGSIAIIYYKTSSYPNLPTTQESQ